MIDIESLPESARINGLKVEQEYMATRISGLRERWNGCSCPTSSNSIKDCEHVRSAIQLIYGDELKEIRKLCNKYLFKESEDKH